MTNEHDDDSVTVNWPLGVKALAAGIFLSVMPAAEYHSLFVGAGVLVAVYALAVPLGVGRSVFSRAFGALALRGGIALAALALTVQVLSIVADSRVTALAHLGSALFIALLAIIAAAATVTTMRKAANTAPVAMALAQRTAERARSQLHWFSLVLPGRGR
jgi:hypothetical protein